jgi:hypothetical protein
MSSIPEWLFDECYLAVGDLAEAISLILPPSEYESNIGLSVWMESRILPLRGEQPEKIRDAVRLAWTCQAGAFSSDQADKRWFPRWRIQIAGDPPTR